MSEQIFEIYLDGYLGNRGAYGTMEQYPLPGNTNFYPVKVWDPSGELWSGDYKLRRMGDMLHIHLLGANGSTIKKIVEMKVPVLKDLDIKEEIRKFALALCPDIANIDQDKLFVQQLKAPLVVEQENNRMKICIKKYDEEWEKKEKGKRDRNNDPHMYIDAIREIVTEEEKEEVDVVANIANGIISYPKQYVLIRGAIQSGKTSFIVAKALQNYGLGMSSIVVLRDLNGDKYNFKGRVSGMKEELMENMLKKGFSQDTIDKVCLDIFTPLSDKDITIAKLKSALEKNEPRIFVTLGNGSSMGKIAKILDILRCDEEDKVFTYSLFIDEVDFVDLTTKGEIKDGDKVPNKLKYLQVLKKHAMIVFGISATVLDTSLKENVNRGNVFVLTPHQNYLGIDKFTPHALTKPALPCNNKDDNPLEKDQNLKGFLEEFCLGKGLWSGQGAYSYTYDQHIPHHCLMNIGKATDPQERLAKYIRSKYPNVAVMVYNGKGVSLSHGSLGNSPISIHGKKSKVENDQHTWTGFCISTVIQWLKNKGVEAFPRIITISGHLAGRSISYVNENYGKDCRTGNAGWRLTDVYMIACERMPIPDLLQAIGRGCVITRDSIGVRLHATPETHHDIHHGLWMYEELMERARMIQDDEAGIGDLVQGLPIASWKKPKKPMTRAIPCTFNEVSDDKDFGGWVESDNGVWKKLVLLRGNGEEGDEVVEIEAPQAGLGDYPEEEFARLTQRMFPRWGRNYNSKIGRFMHSLNPTKVYTKEELKMLLDSDISHLQTDKYTNKKSKGYGLIMEKVSDGYRLYPQLCTDFRKHF